MRHLGNRSLALIALLLALLVAPAAVLASLAPAAAASSERGDNGRSTYSVLQMNLCLSGVAGCYAGTQYPRVVDEAITRIVANDVDAVTLNEVCSGDAERIAEEAGYHLRFATVIYRGAPLPCTNPGERGVFGNAVLTRDRIAFSVDRPFEVFNGVEERRWICATTVRAVTTCTAHLSTSGADAGAANQAQCEELTRVLRAYAFLGPTLFGGDVNRQESCAPRGWWTLTDAEAEQAPGIQHVYGVRFGRPRLEIEPADYTDHDVIVVRARLR